MASIHGIWFVLVGAIVSIVSVINRDLFIPFIFVGAAFLLYGTGKLLLMLRKPKKSSKQKQPQKVPENHPHHHKSNHAFFCKNCGNRLRMYDNFCSHCGMKLK